MKGKFKRVSVIVIVSLLILAVAGTVYYLFVYDKHKPRLYQPQMTYSFLQAEIERLEPIAENSYAEVFITKDGFKGILGYNCTKSSIDEIKKVFAQLTRNDIDGEHIVFPDDSYEIFVDKARYTPITDPLGYGWFDYSGNLYKDRYGKEEAKGKPNYRNQFSFVIRKDDEQFWFTMFCNTDDAEKALSESISYVNEQVLR